jgi:heat shock protein HslJ
MLLINKAKQFLLIIVLMVSLLGCKASEGDLVGSEWELISLDGNNLIDGTGITLSFREDYLGGEMGCNGYGGSPDTGKYLAKPNGRFELIFPFAVTVQLCSEPEGIMEQETAFIEALMSAARYQVFDNRLEFKNENREIILIFQGHSP